MDLELLRKYCGINGDILVFGTKESSEAYQKFFGDIIGFITAIDALRKINKGEGEGLKFFEDNYAEDLLKKAEAWEVPDFLHKTDSKEEPKVKGEKELPKEPVIEDGGEMGRRRRKRN